MSGFGSALRRVSAMVAAGVLMVTGAAVLEVASPVGRSWLPSASAVSATGTGGEFVPFQARLMDTATGVGGYSTPMVEREFREVQVSGAAGLPSSGISAVQVTFTVVDPVAEGLGYLQSADVGEVQPPFLVYGDGPVRGSVSNTAIVALGDGGKIKVMTLSPERVTVDVQGFYTAGATAAGGFVPVDAVRAADTRDGTGVVKAKLTAGSTTSLRSGPTPMTRPVGR